MIVGSILTLGSCKNKEGDTKEETSPFSVVAQKIEENSYASNISVSGNIEGNKTVRLGFMVAGKIDRINVNEGQNVRQGQLIATLDPSNYSIAKEITDVQVNQASDEYSRLKLMHDRNSLSESDFKKIDFTLQGAKAQQKLQGKNLSDTRLFSNQRNTITQTGRAWGNCFNRNACIGCNRYQQGKGKCLYTRKPAQPDPYRAGSSGSGGCTG